MGWEIYLIKSRYILITTKYNNSYSIYYDVNNNCFFKRREKTSKNIYFLMILFIVLMRGIPDKNINYSYSFVLLTAIILGGSVGFLFYVLDQQNKSKSLEKPDDSYEKKQEYIILGKKLLSNQVKFCISLVILFLIVAISLYYNNTIKYFFGTFTLSFVLIYLFNFCAIIKKKEIFMTI